eukprot:4787305-Lingulodinium_polyedra.AAC.1
MDINAVQVFLGHGWCLSPGMGTGAVLERGVGGNSRHFLARVWPGSCVRDGPAYAGHADIAHINNTKYDI